MPDAAPCPDARTLEQLTLGLLPAAEAEGLEQHVGNCPRCGRVIAELRADDSLVAAMRARSELVGEADRGRVADLIGQLKGLTPASSTPETTPDLRAAPPAEGPALDAYPFLAPPRGPDELGRLGPYRVLRVLGSGGMGVVFLAEDPALQRRVALKAMKPSLAAGPAAGERFLREARALAAVKHDHIVTIYQVGEEGGVPFLAMELLEGETLEARLKREGRLPVAEVLRLGAEMASGLAAAHERGLIHRDVKPGNVWLEMTAACGFAGSAHEPAKPQAAQGGRVKLLDFGLVRPVVDDVHLTQSGAIAGTPGYLAPEQARGKPLNGRCDLFSLGCVLYQMTTGQLPFQGDDTMTVLVALATEQPRPPRALNPAVPPALSDLILRLLAKEPAERPPSAQAVADELAALAAAPGPRPRRRRPVLWAAVAVLLAVLGPLGWFFGPTIIRIATNKGELVVAVEDPDVEVLVKPDGVLLRSGKEQSLIVTAGDGVVEVRDPAGGWTLLTEKFSLKRGGKEVVRVRQGEVTQARAARAKETKTPAGTAAKDGPFVLVRKGGDKRGCETLADALTERQEGEAIEVRGDGPFAVPAAEVDGRGLILRAAPGSRPVFVAQVEEGARRPWLAVSGGEVLVEGCDFHCNTIFPGWVLDGSSEPKPAAPWTFRNCRFWVIGAHGLIHCTAPRLVVEDCLIAGTFGEAGLSLAPRVELRLTNNLLSVLGSPVIVAAGNQTLRLTNNTLDVSTFRLLRPPQDEVPARPVTVVAEGNLFWDALLLVGEGGAMPSEKVTRTQVTWQGKDNLYMRTAPYVSFAQEKRELKTLDDWNRFWGRAEPGSIESAWIALQGESVDLAETGTVLKTARQEVEALLRRLGAAARKVGPDWDLIGPGDAYVAARERTSGKLFLKEQLRPQAPAAGPFVLLRDREAPRGHATLQAALDASRDGDVIEIRSDGAFPGAALTAPQRGGRLTIRAAPGYRPALQTKVHLELPKADVEIEGLAFEGHLTGDYGRLTVRNCALRCFQAGIPPVSCVLHGPGQAARFINSQFRWGPICSVGPGQGILLENCILPRANINARADDDDCELVIRRCVCWGYRLHDGSVACDRNPKSQPRVHAEDSVFIGGSVLAWSGRQARWSGTHNVYSLTAGFSPGALDTLEAWQKRWDSDRDSLFTPSPFLEPRLWRILAGPPKRPDGTDYGADVDRVARTAGGS